MPFQEAEEFRSLSIFTLRRRICEGARPRIPDGCCGYPKFYVDLMQQCWNSNPDVRPAFREIVMVLAANRGRRASDDSEWYSDDDDGVRSPGVFLGRTEISTSTHVLSHGASVDNAGDTAVGHGHGHQAHAVYEDDAVRNLHCQSIVSEF